MPKGITVEVNLQMDIAYAMPASSNTRTLDRLQFIRGRLFFLKTWGSGPKKKKIIIDGDDLRCNPQKSNLPAVSSQRKGWPRMEVSKRKLEGLIRMVRVMR